MFKRIFALVLLCLLLSGCGEKSTEIKISEPEEASAAATKPVELDGEYKGRWEMFNCSGDWLDFESYSWDCWAEISDGKLLVWDVDIPKDIGLASLELEEEVEGCKVAGGRFMDIESGFESWRVELEQGESVKLTLRGRYEGNAEGSYSFAMYLEKEK